MGSGCTSNHTVSYFTFKGPTCLGGSANDPLTFRSWARRQDNRLPEETQRTVQPLPPRGFPHFHLLRNAESRPRRLWVGHPDVGARWPPSRWNDIVSTAEWRGWELFKNSPRPVKSKKCYSHPTRPLCFIIPRGAGSKKRCCGSLIQHRCWPNGQTQSGHQLTLHWTPTLRIWATSKKSNEVNK